MHTVLQPLTSRGRVHQQVSFFAGKQGFYPGADNDGTLNRNASGGAGISSNRHPHRGELLFREDEANRTPHTLLSLVFSFSRSLALALSLTLALALSRARSIALSLALSLSLCLARSLPLCLSLSRSRSLSLTHSLYPQCPSLNPQP